eukprot:GHVP01036736.1.p1 GENE.GHVP01036736.1~~GHVP01036736.1.p1  ORF type:complete len:719 (-),score=142.39 GHVP01036736.1:34-2190(-)
MQCYLRRVRGLIKQNFMKKFQSLKKTFALSACGICMSVQMGASDPIFEDYSGVQTSDLSQPIQESVVCHGAFKKNPTFKRSNYYSKAIMLPESVRQPEKVSQPFENILKFVSEMDDTKLFGSFVVEDLQTLRCRMRHWRDHTPLETFTSLLIQEAEGEKEFGKVKDKNGDVVSVNKIVASKDATILEAIGASLQGEVHLVPQFVAQVLTIDGSPRLFLGRRDGKLLKKFPVFCISRMKSPDQERQSTSNSSLTLYAKLHGDDTIKAFQYPATAIQQQQAPGELNPLTVKIENGREEMLKLFRRLILTYIDFVERHLIPMKATISSNSLFQKPVEYHNWMTSNLHPVVDGSLSTTDATNTDVVIGDDVYAPVMKPGGNEKPRNWEQIAKYVVPGASKNVRFDIKTKDAKSSGISEKFEEALMSAITTNIMPDEIPDNRMAKEASRLWAIGEPEITLGKGKHKITIQHLYPEVFHCSPLEACFAHYAKEFGKIRSFQDIILFNQRLSNCDLFIYFALKNLLKIKHKESMPYFDAYSLFESWISGENPYVDELALWFLNQVPFNITNEIKWEDDDDKKAMDCGLKIQDVVACEDINKNFVPKNGDFILAEVTDPLPVLFGKLKPKNSEKKTNDAAVKVEEEEEKEEENEQEKGDQKKKKKKKSIKAYLPHILVGTLVLGSVVYFMLDDEPQPQPLPASSPAPSRKKKRNKTRAVAPIILIN